MSLLLALSRKGRGRINARRICGWSNERGVKVLTLPAVWFQGRGDMLHDYRDLESSFAVNEPQRFVANYRKAGGEIAHDYIDAERHVGHSPDLSQTGDMFERMVAFVRRQIRFER